ncbi:MAG TPA: branched-chain amino acid ABC transporter substrate-binding protein, partial [Candidatus Xenobia bacterium]
AYGTGLARVFTDQCRHLGLTVSTSVALDADQDVAPLVQSLQTDPPDLVYFGGNTQNGAGDLLRAMRDAKIKSLFMGPDGIRESAFIDEAGLGAEGAYASLGAMPVGGLPPLAKEWFDRYRQTYQSDPEPYTLYAYEATRVILHGIEQAGVKDRKAIRDAIMATRDFDGVLGRWSFTSEGDTTIRTFAGYQVHNHHFEFRRMLEPEGFRPLPRDRSVASLDEGEKGTRWRGSR